MKKSLTTILAATAGVITAGAVTVNADLTVPAITGGATWADNTVTWSSSSDAITFAVSDVSDYETVSVSVTARDDSFRIFLVDADGNTVYGFGASQAGENGSPYGSAGTKTQSLTDIAGKCDLGRVTGIAVKPAQGAGSGKYVTISAITLANSRLASVVYADFGTPQANAAYSAPTYTWTASTNCTMPMFAFAEGTLSAYKELSLTTSNLRVPGDVSTTSAKYRVLFMAGSESVQTKYFSSEGEKTIVIADLGLTAEQIASITEIRFAGACASGSVDIQASDVRLSMSSTGISAVYKDTAHGGAAAYNLAGQRVKPDAKGIVIVNGRKYINR